MINKYGSFLLEKNIINLILEGALTASDDFLIRLDSIRKNSKVAELIYNAFNSNYYIKSNVIQNFVDVTDRDDMISFLPDAKATNIFGSKFDTNGRTQMKVGRFAKAILSNMDILSEISWSIRYPKAIDLTEKDYEEFVNLWKSSKMRKNSEFKMVSGEDIKYYYDESNYKWKERGSLGKSCMRFEDCQDYLNIYCENEDDCELLILLEGGELIGRALVWKLTESPCGAEYFMDRVYTASDSDVIKFNNFCDSKGWMRKWKNNSISTDSIIFIWKGEKIIGKASVNLDYSDFEQYPYVDTLKWLKDGTISNVGSAGAEEMTDLTGDIDICYNCNSSGWVQFGSEKLPCAYCKDSFKEELKYIILNYNDTEIVDLAKEHLQKITSDN